MGSKIKDKELGSLSYSDYGDAVSYSCKLALAISSKKVDVFFDTSSKDQLPTEKQRQFLRSIVINYDKLMEKTIPVIFTTVAGLNLKEKLSNKAQLRPVSVAIPQVDAGAFKWDITFTLASLKDTFIIVYFDQFNPLSTLIEKDDRKPWTKFLLRLFNGIS